MEKKDKFYPNVSIKEENEHVKELLKHIGNIKLPDPTEHALKNRVVNEKTIKLSIKKANEVISDIVTLGKHYIDIPEDMLKVMALWALGTYLHDEFNSYPFLFINAMRGSGKTRALNFMAALCKNAKVTNNITESVLFRSANGQNTIIIDENESIIKKEKSALRELLNSAYKKGSYVERMRKIRHKEGEDFVVDKFHLYTPIIMANISGMEEVLSDRCIPIILEKSSDISRTKLMEDFEDSEIFKALKRQLNELECNLCNYISQKNIRKGWNKYISMKYDNYIYTLYTLTTLTTLTTLKDLSPQETEVFDKIDELGIDGRNLELFFPLIMIASILDEKLLSDILRICKNIISEKKTYENADSPDVSLYKLISTKNVLIWHPVSNLLAEFKQYYNSDEGDRDWLNSHWMGRALRRLKLVLKDRRKSAGSEVLLDVAKAREKIKMFTQEEDNENKSTT